MVVVVVGGGGGGGGGGGRHSIESIIFGLFFVF